MEDFTFLQRTTYNNSYVKDVGLECALEPIRKAFYIKVDPASSILDRVTDQIESTKKVVKQMLLTRSVAVADGCTVFTPKNVHEVVITSIPEEVLNVQIGPGRYCLLCFVLSSHFQTPLKLNRMMIFAAK